MGIIDLIMGWGVVSEEFEVNEAEFESLANADKKLKNAN